MTKLDLSMVLWQFKEGKKSHIDCLTAVDAYTSALIAAKPDVSGSLPTYNKDCETCKFAGVKNKDEPCRSCDENYSNYASWRQ